MADTPVYTIGYGSRSIEEFIAILQERGIAYLIDVRSKPYSGYKPDFSREALERRLKAHGIRYVFMGDTLGGQPADPDCYVDGKVDYAKRREQPDYLAGIGRLRDAWQQELPIALMCSEGKPENCHRSKLIGQTLADRSSDGALRVVHIDEDGALLSQAEVMSRVTGGQPSLFGPDFDRLTSRKRYTVEGEEAGHDE